MSLTWTGPYFVSNNDIEEEYAPWIFFFEIDLVRHFPGFFFGENQATRNHVDSPRDWRLTA